MTRRQLERAMKRRTLSERANDSANVLTAHEKRRSGNTGKWIYGYSWGVYDGWQVGYAACRRDQRKKQCKR